ncbi:MAG TPA: PDR/VanB family oxidoreductase [Stellaceae bacterium]
MSSDWFSTRIAAKREEATGIYSYELVDPDGKELPPFEAGAHLDVKIGDKIRQFSLSNAPSERHRYVLGVQRELAGRGGSAAFCDTVAEGDTVVIRGPHNLFPLATDAKETVLLAGGIGVTPILAMAERLHAVAAPFTFHYCTRSRARTAFYERVTAAEFAPQVQFHFDDGPEEQRPDLAAFLGAPDPGKHVYICGPGIMMDVAVDVAKKLGWDDAHLHLERFTGVAAKPGDATEFLVEIKKTGQLITIPKDKTVVEALRAVGIDIPVSCEQGVCATCLTNIVSGVPDHRDLILTKQEHESGKIFTPCVSRALSDILVIDV